MGCCNSRADGEEEYSDGSAHRRIATEVAPLPDIPSRERGIGDITEDQEMTVGVLIAEIRDEESVRREKEEER